MTWVDSDHHHIWPHDLFLLGSESDEWKSEQICQRIESRVQRMTCRNYYDNTYRDEGGVAWLLNVKFSWGFQTLQCAQREKREGIRNKKRVVLCSISAHSSYATVGCVLLKCPLISCLESRGRMSKLYIAPRSGVLIITRGNRKEILARVCVSLFAKLCMSLGQQKGAIKEWE